MKKDIVVLGGGSAGWLTALFIQKVYPATTISVIEDPATPPIIAGESGSATVNKLYNFLEINMDDWIPAVNAMPKLGGKLSGWNGVGTEFIHGLIPEWYAMDYNSKFPEFGRANDFVSCALAEGILQENVYYNGHLQRINKVPITPTSNPDLKFNIISMPMWHFDSRANADYLKKLGASRGIKLIEGKYQSCTRADNGDITSLNLDGERVVSGDWFFDCSGFARLLLHNVIGEQLVDYSNYFPARAAIVWWDNSPKVVNYTDIAAMKYGWSWGINLKHRSGNGYIYDPDLINEDQAHAEVETKLGKKIEPVASLKFTPSIMNNAWRNNVIAIGLSSGFLEPLESNGLAAVVAQLQHLGEHWTPIAADNQIDQKTFNRDYISTMNDIRDFLSLHYRGRRRDTEFWRSHGEDKCRVSDTLRNRMLMWEEGILGVDDMAGYGLENYATVIQGLDLINRDKLRARLLSKRATIFQEFNESYSRLAKEIENIANVCYTTEEWKNLIYV